MIVVSTSMLIINLLPYSPYLVKPVILVITQFSLKMFITFKMTFIIFTNQNLIIFHCKCIVLGLGYSKKERICLVVSYLQIVSASAYYTVYIYMLMNE